MARRGSKSSLKAATKIVFSGALLVCFCYVATSQTSANPVGDVIRNLDTSEDRSEEGDVEVNASRDSRAALPVIAKTNLNEEDASDNLEPIVDTEELKSRAGDAVKSILEEVRDEVENKKESKDSQAEAKDSEGEGAKGAHLDKDSRTGTDLKELEDTLVDPLGHGRTALGEEDFDGEGRKVDVQEDDAKVVITITKGGQAKLTPDKFPHQNGLIIVPENISTLPPNMPPKVKGTLTLKSDYNSVEAAINSIKDEIKSNGSGEGGLRASAIKTLEKVIDRSTGKIKDITFNSQKEFEYVINILQVVKQQINRERHSYMLDSNTIDRLEIWRSLLYQLREFKKVHGANRWKPEEKEAADKYVMAKDHKTLGFSSQEELARVKKLLERTGMKLESVANMHSVKPDRKFPPDSWFSTTTTTSKPKPSASTTLKPGGSTEKPSGSTAKPANIDYAKLTEISRELFKLKVELQSRNIKFDSVLTEDQHKAMDSVIDPKTGITANFAVKFKSQAEVDKLVKTLGEVAKVLERTKNAPPTTTTKKPQGGQTTRATTKKPLPTPKTFVELTEADKRTIDEVIKLREELIKRRISILGLMQEQNLAILKTINEKTNKPKPNVEFFDEAERKHVMNELNVAKKKLQNLLDKANKTTTTTKKPATTTTKSNIKKPLDLGQFGSKTLDNILRLREEFSKRKVDAPEMTSEQQKLMEQLIDTKTNKKKSFGFNSKKEVDEAVKILETYQFMLVKADKLSRTTAKPGAKTTQRPDCQCNYKELKETDKLLAVVVTNKGGFKGRRLNTLAINQIMGPMLDLLQHRQLESRKKIEISTNNSFVLPAGHYYFPRPVRVAGFQLPSGEIESSSPGPI